MDYDTYIDEKIYDQPGNKDPEEIVREILHLGPQKVVEQELVILGNHKNTYTFSKSLAEKVLKKLRGNLRVTIVRPAMIIANYEDPFEGWIDTLAASGGLITAISLGVLHFYKSNINSILDFIPCDFVSNQILVQTAFTGMEPSSNLNVVHSSTTSRNPMTLGFAKNAIVRYS